MDTSPATKAPQKKRNLHNHHMDSTVWDVFAFRDDDIVVASYAKAGTTWTQQIVGQLVFDGRTDMSTGEISPWVDLSIPPLDVKMPMIEAQTHRRFLKTHLPVDALVFSERAKYVYVARDGRDVVWSLHNHHFNANDQFFAVINDTPGRACTRSGVRRSCRLLSRMVREGWISILVALGKCPQLVGNP